MPQAQKFELALERTFVACATVSALVATLQRLTRRHGLLPSWSCNKPAGNGAWRTRDPQQRGPDASKNLSSALARNAHPVEGTTCGDCGSRRSRWLSLVSVRRSNPSACLPRHASAALRPPPPLLRPGVRLRLRLLCRRRLSLPCHLSVKVLQSHGVSTNISRIWICGRDPDRGRAPRCNSTGQCHPLTRRHHLHHGLPPREQLLYR